MSRENNDFTKLHFADYDIAGNALRAWYDANNNLVFVVDETIDEYKPNVLLVINAREDRKWDDILQNDYDLDLELVRPKKDNKYQKLDVEYDGLAIYGRLFRAFDDGADVSANLSELNDFRDAAVRRAAMGRLVAAEDELQIAADTATRAQDALKQLRDKRKNLRTRLERQRNLVGREPTKQSAARILRTESQIDATDEKIKRAQKRLENAHRRTDDATKEANAAKQLLAMRRTTNSPVAKTDVVAEAVTGLPVPEYDFQPETQGQDMSDSEEVKPLLDEDPEILDEEIAFKPVEFDDIKPAIAEPEQPKSVETMDVVTDNEVVPADAPVPLPMLDVPEFEPVSETPEEPVLNTIESVAAPQPSDVDTTGQTNAEQYRAPQPTPRPVSPVAGNMTRPLSPITGADAPRPVVVGHSKPTFAYYLLLILLIAMSVFTLWLYQKKNGAMVPDVSAPVVATPAPEVVPTPIVQTEPVPVIPEPAPVVEPESVAVPEPIIESEPQPVQNDAPINVVFPNQNVLSAAAPDEPVVESEADVLMRKVPYGVSVENAPVAVAPAQVVAPTVVQPAPAPRVTNVTAPGVVFDDNLVSVPGPRANYDEDAYYDDYVDDGAYYNQYDNVAPYYQERDNYANDGGFVPESNPRLSIHDGGQYSITYENY